MKTFQARVGILGINPYISPPPAALRALFRQAGRDKGPIAVRGTLQRKKFRQTLVKYLGAWRLYLSTPMRQATGLSVGDEAKVTLEFDPRPRTVPVPPRFARALAGSRQAQATFGNLSPSRRKEISRYLGSLKTAQSLERNIGIVLQFLLGGKPKGLRAILRIK